MHFDFQPEKGAGSAHFACFFWATQLEAGYSVCVCVASSHGV